MSGNPLQAIEPFFQRHWVTLSWALFTFAIGGATGIQLIVVRNPREYALAMRTTPGLTYLLIRGALPAILYLFLHRSHVVALPPWQEALLLGFGSEGFLRSRILLTFKSSGPNQPAEEDVKGPADFLRWIQDFYLNRAGTVLTNTRMLKVKSRYEVSSFSFGLICARLQNALPALGGEEEPERKAVMALLTEIITEYDDDLKKLASPPALSDEEERKFRLKLGYALYYALSPNSFYAISSEITGHQRGSKSAVPHP